jgi:hypothetical protein
VLELSLHSGLGLAYAPHEVTVNGFWPLRDQSLWRLYASFGGDISLSFCRDWKVMLSVFGKAGMAGLFLPDSADPYFDDMFYLEVMATLFTPIAIDPYVKYIHFNDPRSSSDGVVFGVNVFTWK